MPRPGLPEILLLLVVVAVIFLINRQRQPRD